MCCSFLVLFSTKQVPGCFRFIGEYDKGDGKRLKEMEGD